MRKESSTNAENEARILRNCNMAFALSILGGRWKPVILFTLLEGKMRYNELLKAIVGVSERMLVSQLRELEQHGLVKRVVYPEVPPKVEYELTQLGHSAVPMLNCISEWGKQMRESNEYAEKKDTETAGNLVSAG